MDIASIIGIVIGFGSLALAYTMDGGSLLSLVLLSAFLIVIGGATGAVALSYGMEELKKLPSLIIKVIKPPKSTLSQTIDYIVMLSENARKEGLLSIEKIIEDPNTKAPDPLLKRGIMMVIDGVDLEQIRDLMETEVSVYEQRSKAEISMFEAYGGFAPTFGMVGTIMGLVKVLSNMESPEEMTSSISIAFIATLYGVASANILFLPIANKLKLRLNQYILEKEMIIEGVCAIRNGINPKMLRDKLSVYLRDEKEMLKKGKGDSAVKEAEKSGKKKR